jgi:hypothetical protein
VALGNGAFAVVGNHTFAEEGTSTLSVQVLDVGGSSVSGSLAIAVSDAPLGGLNLNDPGGAVEGKSTGTFTLATFADANAGAPLTDFAAAITWGDGSTSSGTVVSLGGGRFAVLADHAFAEEGTYTLSVQVLDAGGSSVNGGLSVTVADAPLTVTSVTAPGTATEAAGTGTFPVATFTDGNTAAPVTDFTAIVSWGDGTTSAITSGNGLIGSGGSFVVLAGHTYAEEVTTPTVVSVQILDAGGASVSRSSSPFTVADAPLVFTSVNPPLGATEGTGTGLFTVATFTDTNSAAPVTDFKAVIAWGDGTTSTVTSTNGLSGSGGNFVVQAGHTYAEEISTPAVFAVRLLDAGGAGASITSRVAVADAPLGNLAVVNPGATEGIGTGNVEVATFHDANLHAPTSDFTAVVRWGDGSSSTVSGASIVALGRGNFAVQASHTYAEEGAYTLSVQVSDAGGASTSGSRTIAVADAPLSYLGLSHPLPTEGIGLATYTVATFHDLNRSAPVSDFTATVAWGDGGTTAVSAATGGIVALGNGNFAVLGSHTYAEEGAYTLSVQVSDVGGASIGGSRGIGVADAPLANLTLFNPGATEGLGTGTLTVATFSDRNAAAPVSDFTAMVRWGDGSSSTVTGGGIVALGGGSFAVLASHTYAEEGACILSVQVSDVGGASISNSRGIRVAGAPPS